MQSGRVSLQPLRRHGKRSDDKVFHIEFSQGEYQVMGKVHAVLARRLGRVLPPNSYQLYAATAQLPAGLPTLQSTTKK